MNFKKIVTVMVLIVLCLSIWGDDFIPIKAGEPAPEDGVFITKDKLAEIVANDIAAKKYQSLYETLDSIMNSKTETLNEKINLLEEKNSLIDKKYNLEKSWSDKLQAENDKLEITNKVLGISNIIGWGIGIGLSAGLLAYSSLK